MHHGLIAARAIVELCDHGFRMVLKCVSAGEQAETGIQTRDSVGPPTLRYQDLQPTRGGPTSE
jgi:hypothetical protein